MSGGRRRREVSPEGKLAVLAVYGEARPMLAAGPSELPPEAELQPDPELAKKSPRGRSIEEVARIVADAEEFGDASAGRRHGLSASGVAAMAAKWRRHPVVLEAIEARRPAIQARVRARLDGALEELDAKVRALLGG